MEHKFEPFERVIGKETQLGVWVADLYSHYDEKDSYGLGKHACVGDSYYECLPYEGNEHLLGTTNSPYTKHEYKWGEIVEYLNSFNIWEKAIFIQNMNDGTCLLAIRRRSENVFYGFENDKIRPLKDSN